MKFYKILSSTLLTVALVAIVFTVGYGLGKNNRNTRNLSNIVENQLPYTPIADADFAPFWKAWKLIDEKYLPTSTSTDPKTNQDRVWGAIGGMVASMGDPYTTFFPPVESKQFEEEINGEFAGIGAELEIKNDELTVVSPLKDSPAYKAGLKSGDVIVSVDGNSVSGEKIGDSIKRIRGEISTKVVLTIKRAGIPNFDMSIERAVIQIPTIDTDKVDDVFIISLYNFSANSDFLFRKAIEEYMRSGYHKLLVDLRGNPGGYLDSAVDMASWFLPAGTKIVTEDFRDKSKNVDFRSKGYNVVGKNDKIAILMDGGSASASEILAGALKDNNRATLLGTRSFGKGSVQEYLNLTDTTSIKITIARWLTPNGTSISVSGLQPDQEIDTPEKGAEKDTQLSKAIEFLHKM